MGGIVRGAWGSFREVRMQAEEEGAGLEREGWRHGGW